jgi:hypothetical protein
MKSMRQTKTLADLKDSALLYEKTLPTFGYAILLVLLALVCAVVVWSVKTPKVYIVKSTGNVQSENKNYVMSPYSGKIASIGIAEGSELQKLLNSANKGNGVKIGYNGTIGTIDYCRIA